MDIDCEEDSDRRDGEAGDEERDGEAGDEDRDGEAGSEGPGLFEAEFDNDNIPEKPHSLVESSEMEFVPVSMSTSERFSGTSA